MAIESATEPTPSADKPTPTSLLKATIIPRALGIAALHVIDVFRTQLFPTITEARIKSWRDQAARGALSLSELWPIFQEASPATHVGDFNPDTFLAGITELPHTLSNQHLKASISYRPNGGNDYARVIWSLMDPKNVRSDLVTMLIHVEDAELTLVDLRHEMIVFASPVHIHPRLEPVKKVVDWIGKNPVTVNDRPKWEKFCQICNLSTKFEELRQKRQPTRTDEEECANLLRQLSESAEDVTGRVRTSSFA